MPLQDYLNTKRQAEQEIETRRHILRRAYDKGLELTIDQNDPRRLVNLDKLDGQDTRNAFKTAFRTEVNGYLMHYFYPDAQHRPQLDEFQRAALESGLWGIPMATIDSALEAAQEDFTYQAFERLAGEGLKGVWERVLSPTVLSKLTEGDKQPVIDYVFQHNQPADKTTVDIGRVRLQDLYKLLGEFEEHDIIRPRWLHDQPYYTRPAPATSPPVTPAAPAAGAGAPGGLVGAPGAVPI